MSNSILDARGLPGPFAIIGDVHNCIYTLEALLRKLGGNLESPPDGLTLVSVGDLTDKGPQHGAVPVLEWALEMHAQGRLLLVNSNHGARLIRLIDGKISKGAKLSNTWTTYLALKAHPASAQLAPRVRELLAQAPAAIRLSAEGRELVVAHAAASERLLEAPTLTDAEVRFHIASRDFRWRGAADVIVGHVGVERPHQTREQLGNGRTAGRIIRIDTNVDQGGYLSAYLPHEDAFLSVPTDERDLNAKESLALA